MNPLIKLETRLVTPESIELTNKLTQCQAAYDLAMQKLAESEAACAAIRMAARVALTPYWENQNVSLVAVKAERFQRLEQALCANAGKDLMGQYEWAGRRLVELETCCVFAQGENASLRTEIAQSALKLAALNTENKAITAKNERLTIALEGILAELPNRRDWLNPDLERLAKAVLAETKIT